MADRIETQEQYDKVQGALDTQKDADPVDRANWSAALADYNKRFRSAKEAKTQSMVKTANEPQYDTSFNDARYPTLSSITQDKLRRSLGVAPGGETPEEKSKRQLAEAQDVEGYKSQIYNPEPKAGEKDLTPSASRIRDLYRPPEFAPPGETPPVMGRYHEPPLEQYRQEMGQYLVSLGRDPAQEDEHSDLYKAYADAKWRDIYDAAKAEGKPVARYMYASDPTWKEAWQSESPVSTMAKKLGIDVADPAVRTAGSVAIGLDKGALFGIGHRIGKFIAPKTSESLDQAVAGDPGTIGHGIADVAGLGGEIYGVANGLGNVATDIGSAAARRFIPGAAKAAGALEKSLAGSAALEATKGSAQYAGQQLATDVVKSTEPGAEPLHASEEAHKIGRGVAITGPLAFGLGLISAGAERAQESLREKTRLTEAEGMGAKPSLLFGLKPGKKVELLKESALHAGEPDETTYQANKIAASEGPIAKFLAENRNSADLGNVPEALRPGIAQKFALDPELSRQLQMIGVGGPYADKLSPEQYKTLFSQVAKYGRSGEIPPEVRQSLEAVAGKAGAGQMLAEKSGLEAVREIQNQTKGTGGLYERSGSGLSLFKRMPLTSLQLRLDPTMGKLASSRFPATAVEAGMKYAGPKEEPAPKGVEQSMTAEEISRMRRQIMGLTGLAP